MAEQRRAARDTAVSPVRVGLTGGIGSGKTTVARLLAAHGAAVIDADALARSATAPGGAAVAAVAHAFGDAALAPDGGLDRNAMRALVFRDPTARRRLEAIVHPLVLQGCLQAEREAAAQGHRCIVLDVPLLVESGHWRTRVDRVLVVDCRPETQVARVQARSGLDEGTVRAIMATQARREERLAAADCVIHNDGLALAELGRVCTQLARTFGL